MSLIKIIVLLTILTSSIFVTGAKAQQRLDLEGTSIIGNKELPKVLYIVPWKATEKVNFASPPIVSIMDQALTPIDRNTFRRQVRYHQVIFPANSARK